MVTLTRLLTAEDLHALPDNGLSQELVRGMLVEMPPPSFGHGKQSSRLDRRLGVFVEAHQLGEVVVEAGFTLRRNPDTVRAPDVAFVSAARVSRRNEGTPYFEGAPDLAVEIRSPGNTRRELAEKAEEYLAAGTRLVWVFDPSERTLTVYRPDQLPEILPEQAIVSGEDVVPGFTIRVRDLLD